MANLLEGTALRYEPFSGRVSVYLFGRPLDWNIGGDEKTVVLDRLGALGEELKVEHILAPRPSMFNAQICTIDQLSESGTISLNVCLWRGCDADGVEIPVRSGFWLSSADCIIITHDSGTGKTLAAHGGRDCLMDRGRMRGGRVLESLKASSMRLSPAIATASASGSRCS